MILTAAAVAAVAVSAKAQLYAQTGESVTISSLTDASAQGGVTYQWYRNGVLIPECTGASCVVPANLATGADVKFYRRAIALGCAIGNSSNTGAVTITFCNVVVNGVCWGDVNVDGWRTLANQADATTTYFQFNRTKAWAADGDVANWPTTSPASGSWHVDSSPCPNGWRLPTRDEYNALINTSNPAGGVWAAAGSRGNLMIAGRLYGSRAANCTLPNDMQGCVFFPASGFRANTIGALNSRGSLGYSWSSTEAGSSNGYYLRMSNTVSSTASFAKLYGIPVRCVRGGEE